MPAPSGFKARLKRIPGFATVNKLRHKAHRALCNLAAKLPVSSLTFGPPKGVHLSTRKFIEGWKSDPSNPAVFRTLIEPKDIVIPAPRVLLGSEDPFFLTPRTYRSEATFLATLPWGRFYRYPQAFIAPDDRLLVDMSTVWGEHPEDHWLFDKMRLARPHTLRGKTLHLGSSSWFFHFLFDDLPTLDLVERAGMKLAEFDHILLENHGQPYANAVIDQLAIPRGKIVDPREHPHLLCESLTGPSFPANHSQWRSEFLRRAFENCRAESPVSSRRIFIMRKMARGRHLVNEEELMPILRRHGFVMLEMDKFPFAEQIAIFRQAEVIAGPAGAAFTLLNFCRPGTKVLSMMGETDRTGGALMKVWDMVSAFNGLEFYLLCSGSPNLHMNALTAHYSADLMPDVKLFEQMIESMVA